MSPDQRLVATEGTSLLLFGNPSGRCVLTEMHTKITTSKESKQSLLRWSISIRTSTQS